MFYFLMTARNINFGTEIECKSNVGTKMLIFGTKVSECGSEFSPAIFHDTDSHKDYHCALYRACTVISGYALGPVFGTVVCGLRSLFAGTIL